MITILLPFYNLGLGGVQTKIIDLANTLVKSNKYRVILYLEKKEAFDRTNELDARVKVIFCPQFFDFLIKRRYYYCLLFLVLFYRPRSIFSSLEKTSVFLLKARSIWPFICSRIIVNVDTFLREEQIYSDQLITDLYRKADAVLAPSKAATHDFLERLSLTSPPVQYLPNWVEITEKKFIPVTKTREFLFAGRLVAQKDPLLYIKFMNLLKKKGILVNLAIFGEGNLKKVMIQKAKKEGLMKHIHFYETSHQIQMELKKTRFLLLFSKYEGMPLIGLEAMKYGCVILGKNVPGIQDIIQDGVTGISKDTVVEIVADYLKIHQNSKKYAEMQSAAFDYLKANFSQERRSEVIELLTQTAI